MFNPWFFLKFNAFQKQLGFYITSTNYDVYVYFKTLGFTKISAVHVMNIQIDWDIVGCPVDNLFPENGVLFSH